MAQLTVNRAPSFGPVQEDASEGDTHGKAETSRDEAEPKPRLYLDVEGCLCPFGATDAEWGDIASATVQHDGGAEFYVRGAPGLVIALEALRTRYGLELVRLSTWDTGDAARLPPPPPPLLSS
jgi:hypothetical protein